MHWQKMATEGCLWISIRLMATLANEKLEDFSAFGFRAVARKALDKILNLSNNKTPFQTFGVGRLTIPRLQLIMKMRCQIRQGLKVAILL